jgi:hypothetical protein
VGVVRIIGDLGPAAVTLDMILLRISRGGRDDTYFFGAARPIVADYGVCSCTGMQEAGVRTSFKFLVGPEILADPVGKRDRDL